MQRLDLSKTCSIFDLISIQRSILGAILRKLIHQLFTPSLANLGRISGFISGGHVGVNKVNDDIGPYFETHKGLSICDVSLFSFLFVLQINAF